MIKNLDGPILDLIFLFHSSGATLHDWLCKKLSGWPENSIFKTASLLVSSLLTSRQGALLNLLRVWQGDQNKADSSNTCLVV